MFTTIGAEVTTVLGHATAPKSVAEAIALLERVADDRSEYTLDDDPDLRLSIDVLRAAAHIIATGDIAGWVPSWKWHLYERPTP